MKDYAKSAHTRGARRSKQREGQRQRHWLWRVLFFLPCMIVVAVLLWWFVVPIVEHKLHPEPLVPTIDLPSAVDEGMPVRTEKNSSQLAKPAEPQFEFYTVLPQGQVVEDAGQPASHRAESQAVAQKKAVTPLPSGYFIQTGAFKHLLDADQLKTRLDLLGFDVQIKTTFQGKPSLYRVLIGPYPNVQVAKKIQQRLHKEGIRSILIGSSKFR